MPADLVDDAAFLLELARRDPTEVLANAHALTVSWAHGSPSKSHRLLPLSRERGVGYAAPTAGVPDEKRDVRIFGLDDAGRVVLFEDYSEDDRVVVRGAL